MGWGEPTATRGPGKLTFGITEQVTISEATGTCVVKDCGIRGGGLIRIEGVWPDEELPVTVCAKHFSEMIRRIVYVEAENRGLLDGD